MAKMTTTEAVDLLAHRPSVSLHKAIQILGGGKNGGYAAADRGQIPTINMGSRRYVPTAWLRKQLHLDAA